MGNRKGDELVIRPKENEERYQYFTIRVSKDIVKELERISRETGRSRNDIIHCILQYGVKRVVIGEKGKEFPG